MFTAIDEVYRNDNFVIARGTWSEDTRHRNILGIRWEGEDGKVGFPQSRGHEAWLVLDDAVNQALIAALLGVKGSKGSQLIQMIQNT
jgi:hypothetical protein